MAAGAPEPAPGTAPPSAGPTRSNPGRRILVGGLSFVLAAALAAGGVLAFRFVHGAGDRLGALVPDDTAVYATAYLDPPGGQKLAASDLISKFPGVSTPAQVDGAVNHLLDQALKPAGLTHADVRPWLGGQLAAAVSGASGGGSAPSRTALLIDTADGSAAEAALTRFQSGPKGRELTWSTQSFDGAVLHTGSHGGTTLDWALINDTMVLSNSTAYLQEIVRTAHGSHAALPSSGDYTTAVGRLPQDRLGLLYLDVPRLAGIGRSHAAGLPLGGLAAYHGAAFAISAQPGGLALDGTVEYDASKLSAAQRSALQVAPDQNRALGFVPAHAYGVYALDGLPQLVRSVLDALDHGNSDSGGITGIASLFLSHLSGDAALEVDHLAGQAIPAAAVLLAADSDSSAKQLVSTLQQAACGFGGVCRPGGGTAETYRGTVITSVALNGDAAGLGIAPAWAVSDRMAIVATSVAEVRAVLDAHAGSALPGRTRFSGVLQHVDSTDNALLYLDLGAIASAVRDALPPAERGRYDSQVAPYLSHLGPLVTSSRNGGDHVSVRAFIGVS